jgi:hypothetical protein
MRKERSKSAGALISKIRKPTARPTRVEEDEKKYERARERERLRRDQSKSDGERPG